MEFRGVGFPDEEACFKALVRLVHPAGLRCPHCGRRDHLRVYRRHKESWITDYRCWNCAKKFNAWSGTRLQGTHHPPSELWFIIRGIIAGKSTSQLAGELHCLRAPLSRLRHRLERWVNQILGPPSKETLLTIRPTGRIEAVWGGQDGPLATFPGKSSAPNLYTVLEKRKFGY
jgi:transposase-like protein